VILLALASAWLAGIMAAAVGVTDYWPLMTLPFAGAALAFGARGRIPLALASLACAGIALLAIARYESARPPVEAWGIGVYNGVGPVHIRGVIVAEPEERLRSQRLTVRADQVLTDAGWTRTGGRVLVSTRLFPRFQYGDRVEMTARLETPPVFDTFDYRDYLARQGIVSLTAFPQVRRTGSREGNPFTAALVNLRGPLGRALERALPEPEAALARGILLGQRVSIPSDLSDDFNRAGISHLVAISGYNVTLVAGLTVSMLAWLLGRRRATLAAMASVVFFVFLVGAAPSVLRAGVMGLVMLGAMIAGRPGHGLTSIAFAGALLTLWQPLAIDDVAFQLSFASTLGLILVSAPLTERLQTLLARALPTPTASFLGENLGITAASTLAVLPIIGITFGRVSLVALPANVFAVPAFPVILLTSALTSVVGWLSSDLGAIVGQFARLPLSYMILVGRVASDVPGASLSFRSMGLLEVLAIYAGLAIAFVVLVRRVHPIELPAVPRLRPALSAAVLVILVSLSLLAASLQGGAPSLVITVLDVGQGDAILVRTPAGHRILVDGGPSGTALARALGRELGATERRIDLVVLTHAQDDHVAGLVGLFERFEVGAVLAPPLEGTTAAYRAWRELIDANQTPVRNAVAGEWLDLGRGARMEVLWPPETLLRGTVDDLNNNSVVLRLVYGEVSFLLTGDIAAAAEEALLRAGDVRATVFKAAHHGSDMSNGSAFVEAVAPALAVISSGSENPYGHPSPTTLLRLAGVHIYRTDRNGNVRLETDGNRLRATPERGSYQLVEPLFDASLPR
jgi:competence protein ComEC